MSLLKEVATMIEQLFDSFDTVTRSVIALLMGMFAYLDVAASILAVLVLMLQFRVVCYNLKLKKLECKQKLQENKGGK